MMNSKQTTSTQVVFGHEPIRFVTISWLLLLMVLWATNAVVVKIAVRDIPPLWAAFLRFGSALPFIATFIKLNGTGFSLTAKEFLQVFLLALLMVFQIYTFNLGSQFTTGGRVTLFIFSYPLFVPLLAPLLIKEEPLEMKKLIGSFVAFAGIVVALRGNLSGGITDTIKGDLIELVSSLTLAVLIVYLKWLVGRIDKWRIIFWEFVLGVVLFFAGALLFETFPVNQVQPDAWAALVFQSLVVSVFCFMSWQYLLSRHSASSVSVFFFLTPILGMLIGVLILGESFDPGLLVGCLLVSTGIFIVSRLPNGNYSNLPK
jgi:drug/metabolite transporter (DMT)-like permease